MNTTYPLSGTERQNQIVDLLLCKERVIVTDICRIFSVSEATARRDLFTLAEQGLLQRVQGGAIPVRRATPEAPILDRHQEQAEEKKRIGRGAAGLDKDCETIFLGSGTTVLEVAKNLRERKDLKVITNSLPVINLLIGLPNTSMVVLGGMLRNSELSFIGHITEKALERLSQHCQTVAIKREAQGGIARQGLETARAPAFKVEAVVGLRFAFDVRGRRGYCPADFSGGDGVCRHPVIILAKSQVRVKAGKRGSSHNLYSDLTNSTYYHFT